MTKIDRLGTVVAEGAMRLLAMHPAARTADLNAACAAMRAASRGVVDALLDTLHDLGPCVGPAHTAALQIAVMDLARAGYGAWGEKAVQK